jgi:acylphosphatase
MQEIQCKISGRVQGVFYRVYAKEHADKLGITGYVKNLKDKDRNVEIVAQSFDEEKLKDFIFLLKRGSLLSKVDGVETKWVKPEIEFEHFTIEY